MDSAIGSTLQSATDQLVIQYRGFSPSKFAQEYVQDLSNRIFDEAPSSSAVKVMIAKSGKHIFTGFVRISSGAGPFYVMAKSSRLTELAHILLARSRRQLDRWKSKRFHKRSDFKLDEDLIEKRTDA